MRIGRQPIYRHYPVTSAESIERRDSMPEIIIKKMHSQTERDTQALGAELGKRILSLIGGSNEPNEQDAYNRLGDRTPLVAMYGELGSGKTVFIRGMASVLAPKAHVQSPSYTIVNEYRGEPVDLCHFDMYRISGDDDLYSIGFYDYSDCVMAIEWSERIPYALPPFYYKVEFAPYSGDGRDITVSLITRE